MTQEIQNEMDKLKKQINNPSIPDSLKNILRGKLAKLEESVEKTETQVAAIEKKEEQLEKKAEGDLSAAIEKMEKQIKNPSLPESLKEQIKEKLKKAKANVVEVKKEQLEEKKIKEEKIKEVKEEVKETVKEVKKAIEKKSSPKEKEVEVKKAVTVSTEVIKKAKRVKEEASKQVVEKTKKRTTKLKGALRELQAIINANPTLKVLYKGKGVDLKRDAARQAKPIGYRFKGKHNYRIPKNLDNPNVYYEGRPDKGDAYQNKRRGVYFADGGMMEENYNYVYVRNPYSDVVGTPVGEGSSIMITELPKAISGINSPYNKFKNKEIVIEQIKPDSTQITKAFLRETGEEVPFVIDTYNSIVERYADGGMMARGMTLKVDDYVYDENGEQLLVTKVTPNDYFLYEFGDAKAYGYSKKEVHDKLSSGKWSRTQGMARGGMTLKVDDYVYDENGEQLLVTKVTPNDYFLYEFGDAKAYGYSKKEVHDKLSSGKWSRTQGLPEYKVTGYERIYFDGQVFSLNYEENGVEKSGEIKSDSKSNAIKQFKQKHPKAKVTGIFERVKIKEDGGMMARGGKTSRYNKGLSWHQDHARHNSSQNYEVPVNRRKK